MDSKSKDLPKLPYEELELLDVSLLSRIKRYITGVITNTYQYNAACAKLKMDHEMLYFPPEMCDIQLLLENKVVSAGEKVIAEYYMDNFISQFMMADRELNKIVHSYSQYKTASIIYQLYDGFMSLLNNGSEIKPMVKPKLSTYDEADIISRKILLLDLRGLPYE